MRPGQSLCQNMLSLINLIKNYWKEGEKLVRHKLTNLTMNCTANAKVPANLLKFSE
jgi:hypothetical protein